MSTKYFALLTQAGAEKLERAASSGVKLEITHMAVGDGGGSSPTPNINQSGLINEKHRAELDALIVNPQTPGQFIAEQILPEGEGNWWVREIGLFDKDGTLIAVGNCAELYKPESQEQAIRMALTVSNNRLTGWIKELLSGFASRNYVREKIKEHAESRNHPSATLGKKGFVALSNEVGSDSEVHAATPKAVKRAYELANQANESVNLVLSTNKYVPSTRKVNGKELSKDIELTTTDIGAYDKIQTDTLVDEAKQSAKKACELANTKVPLSRKINGKELLTDVEITAHDVNAYTRQEVNGLIANVEKSANTANENANDALKQLDKKVPTDRKINNKELITDIQLTANDVDTYDKKEIDDRINTVQKIADTANSNANTATQELGKKIPESRKINGKELTTDIELSAADVGTYNKVEIDDRISNVEKLTETANNNANTAIQELGKKVPESRKINGKELLSDIELRAVDVGAYGKEETDAIIKDVKVQIDNVNNLAEDANNNANTATQEAKSKVPLTRKVNGKELSADIHLTAADVDTYNKAEIDDRIGKVDNLAETANQRASEALNEVANSVPSTRKVNGKALTTDIELSAADVGTYNKVEIDDRIGKVDKLAETANNNANTAIQDAKNRVPSTRKVNGKELLTDIELTASDVHAYNKKETDDLISGVKTQIDNVQQLANTANDNAHNAIQELDQKVPKSRKINGKELSADIQLIAADVDAYNKGETDAQIKDVKALADIANQNANEALKEVANRVPSIRKVNGKELLTDIELTAADVGTYNKVEIDDRVGKVDKLAESAYNKAETASKDANSKVPSTRKVNGKELLTDIELNAADVGTYNKAELDESIGKIDKRADAANQTANSAVQLADSKVPSTRKVNGKELSTDIELTAANVDAYNKAEINILIDEVKETANNAYNTAEHKVPLTRTVNGKALLSDIDLTASDVNAYTKVEVENRLEDIKSLANKANNNADSRVPLTRTVNGKALLSDIKLTASDVGAYSKVEVDTHINKIEVLASDANTNAVAAKADADSRLAKSKNGADIPDKQAFIRNLGLGNLIGLGIESRRITDEHTIIKLGEILMINGVAVGSEPIGDSHAAEIGGVTYYTHFYKIQLPTTLPNGIISCQASVVGDNFDNQRPSYLADVKTQRGNVNGDGLSKDTLTISVTTPQLGWVPNFYYQVVGY
ncbi:phage tail protein [Xenorhabdus griffiniae]|uniref:Phage tail protein n=1 Tax=Xenorhabdus griffiniae TaxID=351672 RepID=A0ABY9XDU1_9GAMM|nr:phage tail protein [Xenorhabdus griffiniae]MBD1226506.1 phage tail protein [Xenorhabdus griffiniae]MBE8586763.1 phage tail protein [Xenorhabdus griffiniae]WMV71095.1 phage tail protein [Xenorhabdus griffiniae]WNH00771.1 phage tail protein [Xenorhabdus griffiniae]